MNETRRIVGKFLEQPAVGDVFVNAHRHTEFIPRYRVTKVNRKSVLLEGVNRQLNFIVQLSDKATRAHFVKTQDTNTDASAGTT